jgi:hypothetical protein
MLLRVEYISGIASYASAASHIVSDEIDINSTRNVSPSGSRHVGD